MWFFRKKEDLHLWGIRMKGCDQRLNLYLRTTYDKKDYNDYFTLERSLGRGAGYEVVVKIPFSDIKSIDYDKKFFGLSTIIFETISNDECLADLKIEKDYLDKSITNKMIKIFNLKH